VRKGENAICLRHSGTEWFNRKKDEKEEKQGKKIPARAGENPH
jgi:hypothetical protein